MSDIDGARLRIFISYSHRDRRWLDRLKVHLTPLTRDYEIESWDDTQLTPGSRWQEKIRTAIERANVAILIVSADFLASDFIRTNELPPLLKAAGEEGALILPIIASPCLFLKNEISQFQAANLPANSLVMSSEGEQEDTFLKVAETLLHKATSARDIDRSSLNTLEAVHGGILTPNPTIPSLMSIEDAFGFPENFFEHKTWVRLIKTGGWILDAEKQQIIGAGVQNYLLSRREYGEAAFMLETHLQFSNFQPPKDEKKLLGMNAGILLGWKTEKDVNRYYNILLTGGMLLIERVGFDGGQEGSDFTHITDPVPLEIVGNRSYIFEVYVDKKIRISVDTKIVCEIERPTGIVGRVGLRPWRSQISCSKFIVSN